MSIRNCDRQNGGKSVGEKQNCTPIFHSLRGNLFASHSVMVLHALSFKIFLSETGPNWQYLTYEKRSQLYNKVHKSSIPCPIDWARWGMTATEATYATRPLRSLKRMIPCAPNSTEFVLTGLIFTPSGSCLLQGHGSYIQVTKEAKTSYSASNLAERLLSSSGE